MRIKEIKIKNFKAIKDKEYTPENTIAILCAPNGTGKTSFLEAIRFGLTGETPDNCINDTAEETTVEMILEKDSLAFSRTKHATKPTKVKVAGKNTTAKNLDTVFSDSTGIAKDAMKIATSQELLVNMKPDELGAFLLSYVPEEVDFDTVVKYISGITPQAITELSAYLPAMPVKFGLDTVENAYKAIFEARMYANKDAQKKEAQIVVSALEDPARPLSDVEAEEKDILFKEGAQASAKAAVNLYNAAVQNREKAEKNLMELQKQINAITATKPNDEKIKAITAEKQRCNQAITDANKIIAMVERNLEIYNNTLETLNKPVCPISEKLFCTTDKSGIKEEILEMIQSNKEGAEIQEKIIEEMKRKLESLNKEEAEWNENARAYAQKTTLVARYTADKKNLPEIPVKPSVISAETDFSTRKRELQAEKEYCRTYEKNQKLMSEGAALKEKYNTLNFLCKALEPKGDVMNGITSLYLSVFEDTINKRADDLGTGYKVQFIAENGVNYTVKTPLSSIYHPFNDLSHGEQLIALFLLLDMLNSLCGTRLMLLDDINHLDSKNFDTLFSLILSKELQDDYDHIFLCAAANTDFEARMKGISGVDIIF